MTTSLLERAAQRHEGAASELLDSFGGLVWSLVRNRGFASAGAEDLVQDILVDVWQSAYRYKPELGSEATFVATIARRRIIDRMRKNTSAASVQTMIRPTHDSSLPVASPSEVHDEVSAVLAAMAELSPDHQQIIRMSVVQGLSHDQISKATNMPLGTVKTYIRRGLMRVRDALKVETRTAEVLP